MPNTQSRRIALCGVLAALGVVVLLVGSALGLGTYAAPMLACFLLLPALEEYGPRAALCSTRPPPSWRCCLCRNRSFRCFMRWALGPYRCCAPGSNACARRRCAGRPSSPFFNAAVALVYALLLFVLSPPGLAAEFAAAGVPYLAALAVLMNLAFFLCDRAVAALGRAYRLRRRRKRRPPAP